MEKVRLPVLDERMLLIASQVRDGAVVADIGTDHGYVPIYLVGSGLCPRAVATDINSKPLGTARTNAERYGVGDKITFILSDGMRGFDPARYGVTDVLICGMGGELIASILGATDFVRTPGVRLILQPMSSVPELRGYLYTMGYDVKCEKLCRAGDKIYTAIVAEYDGVSRELTDAELYLGRDIGAEESDEYLNDFLTRTAAKLRVQIEGRKKGGLDANREEALLTEVFAIAKARGFEIK
ncbi:MAG: SAM-dependent methyltransferase [Clostridia bacterium]|nr:SAM-dependent methyltransferase [Clostridia bacterium]